MKKLIVRNNFIYCENEKIVLRGVAIPDPYRIKEKDDYDIKKILEDIKRFGANIVRIPIVPSLWQAIPYFLERYIDEIVYKCKELKIYCILDWHAIGNPMKNETRLKEEYYYEKDGHRFYDYESNLDVMKKAWVEISKRYGKENQVLFEVFNEPAPDEKDIPYMGLSALYWADWKKELSESIKIIRENSENIIIISPIRWAYNLFKVIEDPLEKNNIIYSVHPYPIQKNWEENFRIAKNKIPLIVTEWGFDEHSSEEFLKGTKKDYGLPIIKYMEANGISWVAWCYDKIWGPRMLVKKSFWQEKKLTDWGKFVLWGLRK